MLTPLSWLQKYVDITVSPENLAHLLTMVGLEVESIDRFGENFNSDQIVVGEILEINQHPNADRLLLPKVRLSPSETVDVVCGATNLSPGMRNQGQLYSTKSQENFKNSKPLLLEESAPLE
jgi:phenylalanyl-tRNA synthetase beta chain